MNSFLMHKSVMVTGACGTIGSKLIEQLVTDYRPREIICIDNNESELFFLEQRFSEFGNGHFRLADIRDAKKLSRVMEGVDIVFHTAAFKHVILCERSPFEAVQTNIIGMQNLILAARDQGVERVIFTSSDKAVNPTNVMGTTKLMGERLMSAACHNQRNGGPVFSSTRFGNVLGSRGSVIPIFREQIRKGGPVTLTGNDMTRFIMSIDQAVQLVIDSAALACGGEVFITKMPVIRIRDLAEVMIEGLAPHFGHDPAKVEIQIIGSKPGEKTYEELMNSEETRRAWELENYFAVIPAYLSEDSSSLYDYDGLLSKSVDRPYISLEEPCLSKDELRRFLIDNNLLAEQDAQQRHPDSRFWPDRVV